MKNIITYFILFILSTTCCSAASYTYDSARGVVFSWQYDDAIGFYTTDGTRIELWATTVDPNGCTSSFSSYGWSLTGHSTYYLYAPYNKKYYEYGYKFTELPISYLGQTQSVNDDMSHLSEYDFMIGKGSTTDSEADFNLSHYGAILRIKYQAPENETFECLTLWSPDFAFTETAAMNLETQVISARTRSNEVRTSLNNISILKGEDLIVNMMIAPVDLTDKNACILLTTSDGRVLSFNIKATEIKSGYLYLVNLTPEATAEPETITRALPEGTLSEPTVTTTGFPVNTVDTITNGIRNITLQGEDTKESNIYSLAGMRLRGKYPKGIYIHNGKKIISK